MSWLSYLKDAAIEPVGLALICKCAEGADQAKRQLYLARAKAREGGDDSLDTLSISLSPHADDILFIYKRKEDAESTREGSDLSDDQVV